MILDFITQFDKDMEMRREEEEAKKYQEDLEKPSTIKIMGFSVDDIPSQFKLIYVVIFLLVVGGALYYGLSEVTKKKEKVSSKRRKSPKREESKKLSPKKDEKKNAS